MAEVCEIHFTVPGELINRAKPEELTAKAKEAFVMFLLREGTITQGYAARMLGLTRWELMQTMDRYSIPVIDLTEEELRAEVELTGRMLHREETCPLWPTAGRSSRSRRLGSSTYSNRCTVV